MSTLEQMAIEVCCRRADIKGLPKDDWVDALYSEAYILSSLSRVGYQSLKVLAANAFALAMSTALQDAPNDYGMRKAEPAPG